MVNVSVILPCLNEEKALAPCVQQIREVFSKEKIDGEIIVVDNASTDGTAAIAKQVADKYAHEPKRGYGNAYLAGFAHAKGQIIVMGDPDGSYDFCQMPRFIAGLNNADCIIGFRDPRIMQKGAMPFLHKHLGNPLIKFMLWLHGLKLRETCTGFVVFKKKILSSLNLSMPGMEFSSQFIVQLHQKGISYREISIPYHQRIGKSKIVPLKDGMRHTFYLLRARISSG